MRFRFVPVVAAGLAVVLSAPPVQAQIGRKPPPPPIPPISASDWRTPDPDNLLVIDTNKGRIVVELAPLIAPMAVERLKTVARQHFYDGQTFFRVVADFMDQTGDPKNTGEGESTLPNLKGEFTFRRDSSMPFVKIAEADGAQQGFIGVMAVTTQSDGLMGLTADGKVAAYGRFCAGVLGMARTSDPDSANSQFFLMRQTYPSLDHGYTPAGRVIAGEDVVRAIKVGEPVPPPQDVMTRVRLASDLPATERPDIRVLDTASAAFKAMAGGELGEDGLCGVEIPIQGRIR